MAKVTLYDADDVLLIAPTRSAMQRMSKSKCIFVVGKRANLAKPAPLLLCGRELPYVSQADHLGNVLTEKGDMEQDIAVKRARFIQSAVETREMFNWAAPAEILKATKIHCTDFYVSNLRELGSDKAKQVYNAWNTTVKLAWGCPQWTRTYLVQQVLCCGHTSARVEILSRYVKFFHSLRNSASKEVQVVARLMARDMQSNTGKNLQYISESTGLNPWTSPQGRLKAALVEQEVVEVPLQDRWRVPYLCSLLSQRGEVHSMVLEEDKKGLTTLIDSMVAN